jgi:hypothetical protein
MPAQTTGTAASGLGPDAQRRAVGVPAADGREDTERRAIRSATVIAMRPSGIVTCAFRRAPRRPVPREQRRTEVAAEDPADPGEVLQIRAASRPRRSRIAAICSGVEFIPAMS